MKQTIKIVITENQKLLRNVLNSMLAEYSIETIAEAENGKELLELLKIYHPDIVLLDIEMPVMSGDKTLKQLNKEYPDIKIIMLSQYDEQELILNYLTNGASAYVNKNADMTILVDAIQGVKKQGYYYNNIPSQIKEILEKKDCIYFKNMNFSRRESEIIPLIYEGKTNKDIANELNIVVKTVEAHRKNIYKKTQVTSITEFIKFSLKKGFAFLIKE